MRWRGVRTRVAPMMGRARRIALASSLALTASLAACTNGDTWQDDDYDDNVDDNEPDRTPLGVQDGLAPQWTRVGLGVAYQRQNAGNGILIAYGGYSAQLGYSSDWATELVDATLGAAGVGHVYAVQGPADPGYDGREIQNTRLRAHLLTIDDGAAPIYVVAHSSGSYVAHEMLRQMVRAQTFGALARVDYANLDGGGSGLTEAVVDGLHALEFVYARDPSLSSGYSQNHSAATSNAAAWAPRATAFEVKVSRTGCNNGAGWCLHDVVITHEPHNHATFDLSRDYTDFVNRRVTTEYLAPFLP